jgi:hypothetical protein
MLTTTTQGWFKKKKKKNSTNRSGDFLGVATPKPLLFRFLPTLNVSHGSLLFS